MTAAHRQTAIDGPGSAGITLQRRQRRSAVQLGDHVERDMAVPFADIRGFTTIAAQHSPPNNSRRQRARCFRSSKKQA